MPAFVIRLASYNRCTLPFWEVYQKADLRDVQGLALYGLRCPHWSAPLGAGRRLCDRCPCSGSLFPPQAADAFTAVLVLRWCTSATSRIIAIKKQPYAMRKTVSGAGEHSKSEPEASLLE